MIKITTYTTRPVDYRVIGFQVVGHSKNSKLCAIISAITIGGLNNIYKKDDFLINNELGWVSVFPRKHNINEHDKIVVQTIIRQLVAVNMIDEFKSKIKWETERYDDEMKKGGIF
jgi:uncharacterized protein YsxB (DUF464 family)